MRAMGTRTRRRWAGLAVLVVFLVLASQAFAAAWITLPLTPEAGFSLNHKHLSAGDAADDDAGTHCRHRGGTHSLACCLSMHCSLLSPWIATTAPSLVPASLHAFSYRLAIAILPDSPQPAPATPPPRHQA